MNDSGKQIIQAPDAPAAVGPYSQAVRSGQWLFCSGQIPLDPATGSLVASDDIQAQTRQVLENIKTILAHQKLGLVDVLKTTVFLVNLGEFAAMNEVYGQYFQGGFPARSTVQVAALPKGAKVEIEAIAVYP